MSKIEILRDSFEEHTRSLRQSADPSTFIQKESEGVFSATMPIKNQNSHVPFYAGSKQLFQTKHKDSLSFISRRNKAFSEITEQTGKNVTVYDYTRYVGSPFNYTRIDEFFRKESYFSRSIYRQVETMMRNGYEFNSDDKEALTIVKRELARIERLNRIGFNQFVFQAAKNVLKYGICVTRKLKDPRTKQITRFVCLKPQNIIFRFENQTGQMLSVVDRNPTMFGKAMNSIFKNLKKIGYRSPQYASSDEIPVSDLGICLIYDPGEEVFPEPPCFQLLDDILTLRSLEETIELLAFQFGSPLMHVKVGSKEAPVTRTELQEIHEQFVNMAANGMVTTDYNTSVDVISLQKAVADLMPYIDHFKKRVLSGASSSSSSIGESDSGTRSSTESIDNALADHCSYTSSIVANMVNTSIIPDILIANGYTEDQIYGKDGEFLVRMEFLDVDTNKMISHENHVLSLYQGNSITSKEMRHLMLRPPMSDSDKKDTYLNNVQIPLRVVGSKGNEGDAAAAATKSKDQPSNQHGNKLSPGSTKN